MGLEVNMDGGLGSLRSLGSLRGVDVMKDLYRYFMFSETLQKIILRMLLYIKQEYRLIYFL